MRVDWLTLSTARAEPRGEGFSVSCRLAKSLSPRVRQSEFSGHDGRDLEISMTFDALSMEFTTRSGKAHEGPPNRNMEFLHAEGLLEEPLPSQPGRQGADHIEGIARHKDRRQENPIRSEAAEEIYTGPHRHFIVRDEQVECLPPQDGQCLVAIRAGRDTEALHRQRLTKEQTHKGIVIDNHDRALGRHEALRRGCARHQELV